MYCTLCGIHILKPVLLLLLLLLICTGIGDLLQTVAWVAEEKQLINRLTCDSLNTSLSAAAAAAENPPKPSTAQALMICCRPWPGLQRRSS
jgi:hypothetical protein